MYMLTVPTILMIYHVFLTDLGSWICFKYFEHAVRHKAGHGVRPHALSHGFLHLCLTHPSREQEQPLDESPATRT